MKKKYNKSSKKKYFFLLLLFLMVIVVDRVGVLRKTLKVSNPIQTDVLICEGWQSSYSYDSIIGVFMEGGYKTLLVTGNPLDKNVFLPQNGAIIIKDLPKTGIKVPTNKYQSISMHLYGSKSEGEYSKIIVYKNNKPITDTVVLKRNKQVTVQAQFEKNDSIHIGFFNDYYTQNSDRNVILKEIKVNGRKINIQSSNIWLKYAGVFVNTEATSFAEKTARELISKGLNKEQVFFIESSRTGLSGTYNSAFDAIAWLKESGYSSANILTTDYHSKRTYLSYRKVDDGFPIGIVTLPDMSHQRSLKAKLRTAKEIVGSILIRITPKFLL